MSEQPIRIVSYNVRYFGHALRGLAATNGAMRRIAAALAGLSPLADVVCLQEVETGSVRSTVARRGAHIDDELTQLETFMEVLEAAFADARRPFPYAAFYFRAHAYRVREIPIYTTGLAILVNLHTLRVDRHNVASPHPITHHHVQRWKSRKQSRICAAVHLTDAEGRAFQVFNTHLSLPTPFDRAFWRTRPKMGWGVNQVAEAHTLVRFLEEEASGPFVVCGDFNSAPGSPVMRTLVDEFGLTDPQLVFEQTTPETPRGFPTAGFMRMRMHLDHLFSSGPVEWVDLEGTRPFSRREGPFAGLSDHVPLIGRFRLVG